MAGKPAPSLRLESAPAPRPPDPPAPPSPQSSAARMAPLQIHYAPAPPQFGRKPPSAMALAPPASADGGFRPIPEELERNGFEAEPFGPQTIAVKAAPWVGRRGAGADAGRNDRAIYTAIERAYRIMILAPPPAHCRFHRLPFRFKVNTPLDPKHIEWLCWNLRKRSIRQAAPMVVQSLCCILAERYSGPSTSLNRSWEGAPPLRGNRSQRRRKNPGRGETSRSPKHSAAASENMAPALRLAGRVWMKRPLVRPIRRVILLVAIEPAWKRGSSLTSEQLETARAERMRQNGHGALTLEDARTWMRRPGFACFFPSGNSLRRWRPALLKRLRDSAIRRQKRSRLRSRKICTCGWKRTGSRSG